MQSGSVLVVCAQDLLEAVEAFEASPESPKFGKDAASWSGAYRVVDEAAVKRDQSIDKEPSEEEEVRVYCRPFTTSAPRRRFRFEWSCCESWS